MKIGILTGGGDVPGLNPCIKAVVDRAVDERSPGGGNSPRLGWVSKRTRQTRKLTNQLHQSGQEQRCDRPPTGGTFLHTNRTNPGKIKPKDIPAFLQGPQGTDDKSVRDFTPHVLRNLEFLGIDRLIPIGGDDTLSFGERLHSEGFPVVAIPGPWTMMSMAPFFIEAQHGCGAQRAVHPPVAHEQHRLARAHRRRRSNSAATAAEPT